MGTKLSKTNQGGNIGDSFSEERVRATPERGVHAAAWFDVREIEYLQERSAMEVEAA